ncbi:TetR/AcrR family transcriptional regulator [Mycobacterium sp. DL99]|uniref:TetR/AcrR family transcriptional regulator n=1 Tax=Mycobacterium sp. DL99 TaxID=2528957 RepID=UPI0010812588|nr:TetR/AcrR family transcriptional regulator [Mycobacterium sp. DL99]
MSISDTLDPQIHVQSLPARERILATAYRLFYRDGIRATGIDKVIAEAGVTKVTFYRHFASKDALIIEFLDLRHRRWMTWFVDALDRHATSGKRGHSAVVSAVQEWLTADTFRGCAFINSVNELGAELPEIHAIATRHKADMVAAIKATLPPGGNRTRTAHALGIAVDGAVVRAQCERNAASAVKALATIVSGLVPAESAK